MRPTTMALTGFGSILLGWILMFVLPGSSLFAWIIIVAGAALLGAAVVVDFARLRGALASGSGRFGMSTTLAISLFLGIVLLANAISVNRYHRFDFTGLSQFTLTSQTKKVLEDLEEDVEIVQFFTPSVPPVVSSYARDLLSEYEVHSNRIAIREIDPEVQPDQARRYGLDRSGVVLGSVIFIGEFGRRQVLGPQITAEAEHSFTSAILEVSGTKQRKVYFVVGHGEQSVQLEYTSARNGLRDNLFDVGQTDLMTPIPEDAATVVIAGPRQPLSTSQTEIIRDFVEAGGRLLLLLDPNPPRMYRDLVTEWWIEIDDGTLIDPSSHVAPHPENPLVPRERNAFQFGDVFFTGATAILPKESPPDSVKVNALVWTSPEAWQEKTTTEIAEASRDSEAEAKGPLAIGVLLEKEESRIVVIGDSDFAANANFQNGGNSALFLTTVNWLTAGEEIISIDRKVLVTRRLLLNPEQARFLHISSIGLLPFFLLIGAAVVWWRRRQS